MNDKKKEDMKVYLAAFFLGFCAMATFLLFLYIVEATSRDAVRQMAVEQTQRRAREELGKAAEKEEQE